MKRVCAPAFVGAFACAGLALAQTPLDPPKPSPEHKKLEYFAGVWTVEGEMKPGPGGPGGRMTGKETCQWFSGGFNLVCNSTGTGPNGKITGQSILGYSTEGKHYTFYGIDNTGWSDSAKGTLESDTWSWTSEGTMGGQPMKTRYTIKQLSPSEYAFKGELSVNGGPFTVVVEGKETRAP
jgi:hypothetical protein